MNFDIMMDGKWTNMGRLSGLMRDYILLRQMQSHREQVDWEKAKEEVSLIYYGHKDVSNDNPLSPQMVEQLLQKCKKAMVWSINDLYKDLDFFARVRVTQRECSEEDQEMLDELNKDISYYERNVDELSDYQYDQYTLAVEEKEDILHRNKLIYECIRKEDA